MILKKLIFYDFRIFLIHFGGPCYILDLLGVHISQSGMVGKIENHRSRRSDKVRKSSAALGRCRIKCSFDL